MVDELIKILAGVLCLFIGPYMYLHYRKLKKEHICYVKYQVFGGFVFVFGVILMIQGIVNMSLL